MPDVGCILKMIINGPIENFFKNPCSEPSPEGDCVLFHIRRDLVKLLGPEDQVTPEAHPHVMLPLMGILAGIDYLSQIYSAKKGSRDRFVETVREFCSINEDDSQAIYQLRCSIIHSVALSTISDCSHRRGDRFSFEITDDDSSPLIIELSDNGSEVTDRINFCKLRKAFLGIVAELESFTNNIDHPKNAHLINMVGKMHSEKILKTN